MDTLIQYLRVRVEGHLSGEETKMVSVLVIGLAQGIYEIDRLLATGS